MNKTWVWSCFFFVLSTPLLAQVKDDFSDGELGSNPKWEGDVSDFEVVESQLKLNASDAGNSHLYTRISSLEILSWEMEINLDFPPSTSNRLQVYLQCDTTDLSMASGYFIELGASGDDDRWLFFRMVEGTPTLLTTGSRIHAESERQQVRILREGNTWRMESKRQDEITFNLDWSWNDQEQNFSPAQDWFLIACQYTSTRRDKFIFDDFCLSDAARIDTVSPKVISTEVTTDKIVEIVFSEPLDSTTVIPENFALEPDGLIPESVRLSDPITATISLPTALVPLQSYFILYSGISDLFGNQTSGQVEISYALERAIAAYDILFNEIYDDPTPSLGLPGSEYIELLVHTEPGIEIDLASLKLQNFATEIELPSKRARTGDLIVLCDIRDTSMFDGIEHLVGVPSLPTLLNGGNQLKLLNHDGEIIHAVGYDDNWYRDPSKDNGGWSLELINPNDPCALQSNWIASQGLLGGTPGQINSVYDPAQVSDELTIIELIPTQNDRILIDFNRGLSPVSFANFAISGGQAMVAAGVRIGPNQSQALLFLDPPMQRGIDYTLEVISVSDCTGSTLSDGFDLLLPQAPEPGDILINEILFNPRVGGSDFVEIYNHSAKAFQIQDLALGAQKGNEQQLVPIIRPGLLRPGQYLVFSPDPADIMMQYDGVDVNTIRDNRLPSLPDEAGHLAIIYQENNRASIIDEFEYDVSFHANILRDDEGVSLERLDFDQPTNESQNWHSAASTVGFATPTQPNSQMRNSGPSGDNFTLDPPRLSPDGDGFEDFLDLHYRFENPGVIANILIYDAAGRQIKHLVNSATLSTDGTIKWDGDTDEGGIAPMGIYTIFIEYFTENGAVNQQMETCVVAGKIE